MKQQKEIINRIEKGESYIIYFQSNADVYQAGMTELEATVYHLCDLEDMAMQGIPLLLSISHGLAKLVEKLEAMRASSDAVADLINPEE